MEDKLLSFWYICLNKSYLFNINSQLIKCLSKAQISHMFFCSQDILWCDENSRKGNWRVIDVVLFACHAQSYGFLYKHLHY